MVKVVAFDYLDVKKYLNHMFKINRKNKEFSTRKVAKKLGIPHSTLSSVLCVKMGIDVTDKMQKLFIKLFGLAGKERKYFIVLCNVSSLKNSMSKVLKNQVLKAYLESVGH